MGADDHVLVAAPGMSANTFRSRRPGTNRPPIFTRTRIPSSRRAASAIETNAVGGVVMWTCADMNGIAPIENGLVNSRATSCPAASTTAKFASFPSPIGFGRRADPPDCSLALERVGVHARAGGPALAFDLELRLVRLVADQVELLETRLEAELAEGIGDDVGGTRRLVGPGLARADVDRERLDRGSRGRV